jgi:hypothetical protein
VPLLLLLLVCFNESGSLNTYFGSAPGGGAREVPPRAPAAKGSSFDVA